MSHVNSPKKLEVNSYENISRNRAFYEPSITAAMFGFLEAALQQHQITQWVRPRRILLGPETLCEIWGTTMENPMESWQKQPFPTV
jgi:hypothetical protein